MQKHQLSKLSEHSTKKTQKLERPYEDKAKPVEVGGQKGPEPTRYGDWEKAGRCSDF